MSFLAATVTIYAFYYVGHRRRRYVNASGRCFCHCDDDSTMSFSWTVEQMTWASIDGCLLRQTRLQRRLQTQQTNTCIALFRLDTVHVRYIH